MSDRLSKIITISSLFLVVVVFVITLFWGIKKDNNLFYVIDNENLCKMDENTSVLFEKLEEETSVIEEEKKEVAIQEVVQKQEAVITTEVEGKVEEPQKVEIKEVTPTDLNENREVIQTLVGTLTGYGPDCVGCGGHTSSGFDLTKSIYFEDGEYGSVRILAADRSIPFYSIVRVSNVPTMDFIGIVLDRGGNVGYGKGTLFDLAFESERSPDLVPLTRNVTFEILRSGR